MQNTFIDVITSEEQLREVIAPPSQTLLDKVIPALDEHCRAFIAKSPFILIASADAIGSMDVSPKGDPAGFVQVLDDKTLAIPDRPGNRRADTLTNILRNPKIALLFLIPGKQETLRVNGSAMIVRDSWLLERMTVRDKSPNFAIVVSVEEAFMHCAKCVIRSKIWDAEHWPDVDGLASLAHVMVDHAKLSITVDEMQGYVDESYRDRLY